MSFIEWRQILGDISIANGVVKYPRSHGRCSLQFTINLLLGTFMFRYLGVLWSIDGEVFLFPDSLVTSFGWGFLAGMMDGESVERTRHIWVQLESSLFSLIWATG